jgi:hypothetical protein
LSVPPHRLHAFRQVAVAAGAALCLAAVPLAAHADHVSDTPLDFAPTYVGVRLPELDIRDAVTIFNGEAFDIYSSHGFTFPANPGAPPRTFVWGVDRGAGEERLVDGSPSLGQGVFFDAVVVLTVTGLADISGFVTTFGPGGPLTTDLDDNVFTFGDLHGALVPVSLLPSTGFAFTDYRFNLWSRDGAGNDHIADFALEGGMFGVEDQSPAAVPEPATWALMIGGFGMAGAALRRRRAWVSA